MAALTTDALQSVADSHHTSRTHRKQYVPAPAQSLQSRDSRGSVVRQVLLDQPRRHRRRTSGDGELHETTLARAVLSPQQPYCVCRSGVFRSSAATSVASVASRLSQQAIDHPGDIAVRSVDPTKHQRLATGLGSTIVQLRSVSQCLIRLSGRYSSQASSVPTIPAARYRILVNRLPVQATAPMRFANSVK